jgi:hypothetical protein
VRNPAQTISASRRWARFLTRPAALMAIAISALALSAGVASAATPANTGNACWLNSGPSEPGITCVNITGTGLHIKTMKGWWRNESGVTLSGIHIELEGPNGRIKNGPTVTVRNDSNSPNVVWSPNRNEKAGRYCSVAWYYEDHHFVDLGGDCVSVRK